ncbi:hypothetical protein ACGFI9_02135 [Micromonospora sp. NPDC048930]|uniref:hypothetical protein n=1 Tax=Micromonospora sp. NPDC048930 TaxID=3364261 RepID=UPI00371CB3D9
MTMTMPLTLADLTGRTGLTVLDHLEQQVRIPVLDGLQAQGDLIVVPLAVLDDVHLAAQARWRPVPPEGVELLRGAAGGNPHTLVAEPGDARWTTDVTDPERLAVGVLRCTGPTYLVHPEHGGSGVAPGTYLVRRQRERSTGWGGGDFLVAD